MSSFTLSDPRFAGLRLPQTPPILNTDIYYLETGLHLLKDGDTETHTNTQVFALFDGAVWICVGVWSKDNAQAHNEIFKKEQHIAQSVWGHSVKRERRR